MLQAGRMLASGGKQRHSRRVKLHFLDTSALTDLVEPGAALARHRLIDEVSAERILVLGTAPLLLEMSETHAVDGPKHQAMLDLFDRITRGSTLLADPPTRRERELRARGALAYPGFLETGYAPTRDPQAVNSTRPSASEYLAAMRSAEATKALNAKRELDALERDAAMARGDPFDDERPPWRAKLKAAFARDPYVTDLAEHYARTAIAEYGATLGVSTDGLTPQSFPTFWSSAVIHVARMRAVLVGGTSPTGKKSASQIDILHLEEAASYADVFVSSDGRLRAFAGTVPNLACKVISFLDWERELTG